MLTIELKIKQTSNLPLIEECSYQYTGLFYKLYNNPDLLADPSTKIELLQKYNLLDVSMYDFCTSDVKTKLKQHETNQKNKVKELESITKELEENDFKGKKGRTKKYSLLKKQRYLQRTLGKNSCFGGKANLRKITKYSQFIQSLDKQIKVESEKTKLANLVKQKEESLDLLSKVKEEFHENRKLGIYIIGAANKVGNRNYNFDLTNNKLTFKPNKDNHVDIEFHEPRGKKLVHTLSVLQAMSDERMIPLTVRLTADKVYITYNEELIAGYSFDQKGCTTEQKGVVDKEVRTEIFKKYKAEQDGRKLKDKLSYRYMSVDLNPYEIGLTIADIKGNNFTLVYKEVIKLEGLSTKLGLSSDHPKQKKQNNKRKFKLPTGHDADVIKKEAEGLKKINPDYEAGNSLLFRQIIIEVNGDRTKATINSFVDRLRMKHSKGLYKYISALTPGYTWKATGVFTKDGKQEKVEDLYVPFTPMFFWP